MSELTAGSGVAAGVVVVRETDDGVRFLLIREDNEGREDNAWRLPIAVADNVAAATEAALRQARLLSGCTDITLSTPPSWFAAEAGSPGFTLAIAPPCPQAHQRFPGCWADLSQCLALTPTDLHAPLIQAAALLMKIATVATPAAVPSETPDGDATVRSEQRGPRAAYRRSRSRS